MKRRKGLLVNLAWAIGWILNSGKVSYQNVRRYVTRDVLRAFRIRTNTKIHEKEFLCAMFIAQTERRTRPDYKLPLFKPPSRAHVERVYDKMVAEESEFLI